MSSATYIPKSDTGVHNPDRMDSGSEENAATAAQFTGEKIRERNAMWVAEAGELAQDAIGASRYSQG